MSYFKIPVGNSNIDRELFNQSHVEFPQVGDYWHERFCPYFIILEVLEDHVIICDKKKDIDRDHWDFDLSVCKLITKQELERSVKYSTMDKFVADVVPERLIKRIPVWKEMYYVLKTSTLETPSENS